MVKDVAQRLDVDVPAFDHMIWWHQRLMGREYLSPPHFNRLDGADAAGGLARYGLPDGLPGIQQLLSETPPGAHPEQLLAGAPPPVLCFDVDETLWDFAMEDLPLGLARDLSADAAKLRHRLFADVPSVLAWADSARRRGLLRGLTLASRTWRPGDMRRALGALGYGPNFFSSPQLYPTGLGRGCNTEWPRNKLRHFLRIERDLGVDLKRVIFFDNEARNCRFAREMGITAVFTPHGLTWAAVAQGIDSYRAAHILDAPGELHPQTPL